MVTENCKKIEPVVAKLRSKTKYTTFFLNTVYSAVIYVIDYFWLQKLRQLKT